MSKAERLNPRQEARDEFVGTLICICMVAFPTGCILMVGALIRWFLTSGVCSG